ncbi:MAG: class I SAM-dependent methyltransferase [Cyclonatronaceae bacterium]
MLPAHFSNLIRPLYWWTQISVTRLRVATAFDAPSFLGASELEKLQTKYPIRDGYKYDDVSILKRGRERTAMVLALPGSAEAQTFLEVGCGEGMVSAMLHKAGKTSTGIDLQGDKFDPKAVESGASLLAMDAEKLGFEDETFDYIVSFNSFEHFPHPDRVLDEMIRVLKPGGHIYLQFGPLYNSAFGEHAYRVITVPYCQFLFSLETMNEYAVRHGRNPIDPHHVNQWSLEDYRALWKSKDGVLSTVMYNEKMNPSHLDILRKYPSCFNNRVPSFENYLVTHISAVFRLQ